MTLAVFQEACTLTYRAVDRIGWYAVAIQVEDFVDRAATSPLSSIPVQFLVVVAVSANESCAQKLEFIPPTPEENACIGVELGTVFNGAVVVRVKNPERRYNVL